MPRRRLTRDDYRFTPKDRNTPVVLASHRPPPMRFKAYGSACDFSSWYGHGIDDIANHLHNVLWERHRAGKRAEITIGLNHRGLTSGFIAFMNEMAAAERRVFTVADINKARIVSFIDWLRHFPANTKSGLLGYRSQEVKYFCAKSVLTQLCIRRLLPPTDTLFPRNPYPGAKRRAKGAKAYSSSERARLLEALTKDLLDWKAEKLSLTMSQVLVGYLLMIAARTGRNTTPLLELTRRALRPHPLKPNRWLFVTYKRRGYSTHIQSFAGNEGREIQTMTSVRTSVVTLYEEVLHLTEPLVAAATEGLRDRLWLYKKKTCTHLGKIGIIGAPALIRCISDLVNRHGLAGDDGTPLRVNISRLRRTFVNAIFEETGGNLFATAILAGHTPRVSDTQYLEAPPEAERHFKFVGEALVDRLRGNTAENDAVIGVFTPVSHCRDSIFGRYAPHDGTTHCMDFLNCFRCPSQIVTGDDLWRLFSFYWLLIHERNHIPRNRWHHRYGWVIREIDRSIAPKFDTADVKTARDRARQAAHPMWFTREALLTLSENPP